MEEENRKGPGIFYAVVGVATLVVAIIGATFAYFSASATPDNESDAISGETNANVAADLSISVEKLNFANNGATSNDLVPAVLTSSTTAGINAALTAKCVEGGFTGCHVYKITATSDQNVNPANILLDLAVTATNKANWKYVVYTGSDTTSGGSTTAASATTITKTTTSLSDDAVDVDLHNAAMTAETPVVYYLMIYLENTNVSQNNDGTTGATSDTGSYSGSVELRAMSGQVKATFSAS